MSDPKKPTDESSTDESGRDLTAEELENVAGGLAPPPPGNVGDAAFKHIKWAPEQKVIGEDGIKIIGPVDGVAPALKK